MGQTLGMPLSDNLRPAHFPVAAGLAPSALQLEAETNSITRDCADEVVVLPPALGGADEARLQIVVVRLWGLFKLGEDSTVSRVEYDDLLLRLLRVLLPALHQRHEEMLLANAWEEDAGGLDGMPFSMFFAAMWQFAKHWTGSADAAVGAQLIEDLALRITRVHILRADGRLDKKEHRLSVQFQCGDKELDPSMVESTFAACVSFATKGHIPAFSLDLSVHLQGHAVRQMYEHSCIFDEAVMDPCDDVCPCDSVSLVWAPIEDIVPMGHAALIALRQMALDCGEKESIEIDVTGVKPKIKTATEAVCHTLEKLGNKTDTINCVVVARGVAAAQDAPVALVEATQKPLAFMDVLGCGVRSTSSATVMRVLPAKGSQLYLLEKLRAGLRSGLAGVASVNAADAALPGFAKGGADEGLKLASFPDVLEGSMAMNSETGLVERARDENLFLYGSLSSLARNIVTGGGLTKAFLEHSASLILPAAMPTTYKKQQMDPPTLYRSASFPAQEEGLNNDLQDVLTLARTPPVTLWVFGNCDKDGEYKTEACRRLAQRMGLQWLKPAYLLELAVKTPRSQRTPLMERCAEMLQRGMAVSTVDALLLAHEAMCAARCKTNGYVLELPPLTSADEGAVLELAARARELSVAREVRVGEVVEIMDVGGFKRVVLKDYGVPLPLLKPESEPPPLPPEETEAPPVEEAEAPPPAEEDEGGEGGEGAEAAEGGKEAKPAVVEDPKLRVEEGARVMTKKDLYITQDLRFQVLAAWQGTVESVDAEGDALILFDVSASDEAPASQKRTYIFAQDFVSLKNVPTAQEIAAAVAAAAAEAAPFNSERSAPPRSYASEAEAAAVAQAGVVTEAAAVVAQTPPLGPMVPNPWADMMPRRLILLSTETDELGAWKLGALQRKHSERQAYLNKLEEEGELPPDEEEDGERPEPEALPEDEVEQAELFQKCAGDVLLAMERFVPAPALAPPRKLPPLPDTSKALLPEEPDIGAPDPGAEAAAAALRKKYNISLLSLRADGRPPAEAAELLYATTGDFQGPTGVALPVPLDGASAGSLTELLRCPAVPLTGVGDLVELNELQASRLWSSWRQYCPVSAIEKRLKPGDEEALEYATKNGLLNRSASLYRSRLLKGDQQFAVDFGGRVLLFAGEQQMRQFCAWPRRYLADAPRINGEGLALGFLLLSPCGFRCKELASRMRDSYGFDVVDVIAIVEDAMKKPAIELPRQLIREEDEDVAAVELHNSYLKESNRLRLREEEKQKFSGGGILGRETLVRLVGEALGIERNAELVKQQRLAEERQVKMIEDAQAAEQPVPPLGVTVDEDGKPVVDYAEPLQQPQRGFVLIGFPETVEDFNEVKESLKLDFERVLVLKKGAQPPTEVERTLAGEREGEEVSVPPELLAQQGFTAEDAETVLETAAATAAALEEAGAAMAEVALEADTAAQFVAIRKLIDPFYTVVEESTIGLEIPDPDSWEAPEPPEAEEGQEPPEPPERPRIPWGVCGPYCPVTLKNDFWLFPGQKESPEGATLQHVVGNSVYAFASAAARDLFLAEPAKYAWMQEPALPPPRILVTGPTGSGVAKQCELLSKVYNMPVLQLERAWLQAVGARVDKHKALKKQKEQEAALAEQAMAEDGVPVFPVGWKPPEPQEEDAEEAPADAEAEPEPEDDGIEDADAREALYVEAMRDVLNARCGGCIVDGSFFGDVEDTIVLATVHVTLEVWEEMKEKRALQNLLTRARRIPDVVALLKCKPETAARATFDFDAIDREFGEKVDAFKKKRAEYEKQLAAVEAGRADPASAEDEPDPVKYGLPEGFNLDEEQEEKESQRVKAKFIEKKAGEEEALKEIASGLKAARATVLKLSADRGMDPTHKAVRWHCRGFLEHRASLFLRWQTAKASPSRQQDALSRSLAMPSFFGDANPMATDAPLFAGQANAFSYGVELRRRVYYPRSEAEREQFLLRPQDFIHLPVPSRVSVHPSVVVVGPPLAGKTQLARSLAERTGAVYLSVPKVVARLCGPESMPSGLSRRILAQAQRGAMVPDEAVIEALKHRLAAPDVLARGWVLDDFPLTEKHARLLTQAGVVPHRFMLISLEESQIFARCAAARIGKEDHLVQQEAALQRKRMTAYAARAPPLMAYYGLAYDNVCCIDGSKSVWAINDQALRETSSAVSRRLEYYRRTANGEATCLSGMCFTPERIAAGESDWKQFCPVQLTLNNELVACKDPKCAVEYKSKIYWTSSAENAELFISDPVSFLQVPLPSSTPQLLKIDPHVAPSITLQLDGYCPVALVDKGELIKASFHHIVRFQTKNWSIHGKDACQKFMRRPMRYLQRAKLPSKRPAIRSSGENVSLLKSLLACRDGKNLEPAEMLTYMQACVAEGICQALVESGERRPLCPGKTPQESALLFLADFLRARNPLNTELRAGDFVVRLEAFLSDCALPHDLKEFTERKAASKDEWTGWDTRKYAELSSRFDQLFKLPP